MLTLLPLQFLSLFAYFLLRILFGFLFFHFGMKILFLPHRVPGWLIFSLLSSLSGLLLLVGLATQAGAVGALTISIWMLMYPRSTLRSYLPDNYFWILAIGVSLSLFITGAGVFAIDLPI